MSVVCACMPVVFLEMHGCQIMYICFDTSDIRCCSTSDASGDVVHRWCVRHWVCLLDGSGPSIVLLLINLDT
jgi:hypothetical protein